MDAAINNLKVERLVNALRQGMVYPRIGRHLDAALAPRPVFSRPQEQCPYAFFAITFQYKPALYETDRALGSQPSA